MNEIKQNNVDVIKNRGVDTESINEYQEVVEEKLNLLKGAVTKAGFSANIEKIIENLYISVFKPDEADNIADELKIKNTDQFPDRLHYLKYKLPVDKIPDSEEFAKAIKDALRKKVDFTICVYKNAVEELKKLINIGPVFIWTSGDAKDGYPEHGYQGSWEQFFKISPVVSPLRRKIGEKSKVKVFAGENKVDRIEEMCEEFHKQMIKKIVIIEDQVKNLNSIMLEIKDSYNFTAIPIWIRQGFHKDQILSGMEEKSCVEKFNAINSLKDLGDKLVELNIKEGEAGFVVDWDGVISDDKKRQELQSMAVYDEMVKRGWLKTNE